MAKPVALAGAMLILTATPAAGQEWRLESSADPALTAALAVWPSGHAVVARCEAGDLQAFVRMPAPVAADGGFGSALNGAPIAGHRWGPADDRNVVFSDRPALLLRRLRGGGQLSVGTDASGAAALALPTDGDALAAVLEACDKPLIDPRDDLPVAQRIDWVRRARGDVARSAPAEAMDAGVPGRAVISCLLDGSGRLTECRIEREQPPGYGFGRASAQSARDFRFNPRTSEVGALLLMPMTWEPPTRR